MSRKWRGSKLQCKLLQQYTRVLFMTKAIASLAVNKDEEKEMEEKEKERVEEENK